MNSSQQMLSVSDHNRSFISMTYVYPVVSRRAGGVSVGINLNPNNACNWHCAYCQVPDLVRGKAPDIDLLLLEHELSGFLADLIHGDWMERFVPEGSRVIRDIAFSGNGEPTSAEVFAEAVDRVLRVRDAFGLAADAVPVRLITNGSLLAQARVQDGVRRLGAGGGEVWFKVDAGTTAGIERINGVRLEPAAVARNLARCAELCPTWVQTCVFRWDGAAPEEAELDAYLDVLAQAGIARLKGVLLYGVARPSRQPEAVHVSRLSEAEMEQIAERIRQKGLTVRVSP